MDRRKTDAETADILLAMLNIRLKRDAYKYHTQLQHFRPLQTPPQVQHVRKFGDTRPPSRGKRWSEETKQSAAHARTLDRRRPPYYPRPHPQNPHEQQQQRQQQNRTSDGRFHVLPLQNRFLRV